VTPEEVFSFRALWAAASKVCRGKRWSPAIARMRLQLEDELFLLRDKLLSGQWSPSPVREMTIHDGKTRNISVPSVRDRIVHHAIMAVLAPRIERRMIAHSFACRSGKGTHAAFRLARAWARTYPWFVHIDVIRYFPSIDHEIIRDHLAQDVREPFLRSLCERILDASAEPGYYYFPGDDLLSPLSRKVGLPLGSLTSQYWANRFLDPLDHLVKDRWRVRPYLRYMDDLLIFDHDCKGLARLARNIENELLALRLRIHPYQPMRTSAGVTFVGYRILPDCVRVKRSTVARAERRLCKGKQDMACGMIDGRRFAASLEATFAHWSHASSWRLRHRTLARLGLLRTSPESIVSAESTC
jgi:RNA-directed DNA polymerase